MNDLELIFLSSVVVVAATMVYAYISELGVGIEKGRGKSKKR